MSDTIETLHDAIKRHSGMDDEQIREAGEHGADAGWPGFSYTSDAVEFYEANKDTIYELVRQSTDDMGYGLVVELVAMFARKDMTDTPEDYANLMAWFALEEVGRSLDQ